MRNGQLTLICLVLLLMLAAPARAALPDDGAVACAAFRSDDLIYIGEPGAPFQYRLFQEQIDQAQEALVKARAAFDKSPGDVDLLLALKDAEYTFNSWTGMSVEMMLVPMKIARVFRGNPAGENFVMLGAYVKEIVPGRSYLFHGDNHFAMYGLNIHSGPMHDIGAVPQALRVFEGAANSESGTIYGALNLESATGGHVPTPLASTRVRLTAPGYADDVATDADGIFVAFGVPPGTVTITPLMTDQLAVTNRALLSMKVVGGQCTSVDLLAAPNGRIRGRIVGPDGKPRSGLPLHLVRSEPQWDRRLDERYTVTTDERGEYEFSAIPPGSYLLGHQIIGPHLVMPSQTLPPKTYYPGSADAAGANPIVVGNATQHDGIDFVVEHTGP